MCSSGGSHDLLVLPYTGAGGEGVQGPLSGTGTGTDSGMSSVQLPVPLSAAPMTTAGSGMAWWANELDVEAEVKTIPVKLKH